MKKSIIITIGKGAFNKINDDQQKEVIVHTFVDSFRALSEKVIKSIYARKRNAKRIEITVQMK